MEILSVDDMKSYPWKGEISIHSILVKVQECPLLTSKTTQLKPVVG